jgi:hypothetical protein
MDEADFLGKDKKIKRKIKNFIFREKNTGI